MLSLSRFVAQYGVQPGSNLGLLIFLLFIDIIVSALDLDKFLCADDFKVFRATKN